MKKTMFNFILKKKSNKLFCTSLILLYMSCFECLGANLYAESGVDSTDNLINFRFSKKTDIKDIIKFISKELKVNVIFDNKVRGSVQVIVHQKLTRQEAYQIFVDVLTMLNFTVVEVGNIVKIIPKKALRIGVDSRIAKTPYGSTIVTKIFNFKEIRASEVKKIISRLVDSTSILVFDRLNSLILTGYAGSIQRLETIISFIARKDKDQHLEVIPISYSIADDVLKKIKDLGLLKHYRKYKILADKRTNSIWSYGSSAFSKELKELVKLLDQKIEATTDEQLLFKRLDFVQAKKIVALINQLKVKDSVSGGKSPTPVGDLTMGKISADVVVSSDEFSNAIIAIGEKESIKTIKAIVGRLDIKRAQVFLEVEILEINESYGLEFKSSHLGLGGNPVKNLKVITGWHGEVVSPLLIPQVSGETDTSVEGLEKAIGAFSEDLTIGVMSNNKTQISNIGSLSPAALIKMLKTDSRNKVLMSPYLLTTDNEESYIKAGETFSYLREEKSHDGIVRSVVKKEDIAISVNITPKVSNERELVLKLGIELGSVIGISEGQARFAKRKIAQDITLQGGQTAFVSGFVTSDGIRTAVKVPFLGDIPIFGLLFKNLFHEYLKTYLLVFVTPHIIYGTEDMLALYEEKRRKGKKVFERPKHIL